MEKSSKEGACYAEGTLLVCSKNGKKVRVTGDDFYFERVPLLTGELTGVRAGG